MATNGNHRVASVNNRVEVIYTGLAGVGDRVDDKVMDGIGGAHIIVSQSIEKCLSFNPWMLALSRTVTAPGRPLAKYAARYWVTHAGHAQFETMSSESRLQKATKILFDLDKPHFCGSFAAPIDTRAGPRTDSPFFTCSDVGVTHTYIEDKRLYTTPRVWIPRSRRILDFQVSTEVKAIGG